MLSTFCGHHSLCKYPRRDLQLLVIVLALEACLHVTKGGCPTCTPARWYGCHCEHHVWPLPQPHACLHPLTASTYIGMRSHHLYKPPCSKP